VLHINYLYLLDRTKDTSSTFPLILDYGCGSGEAVEEARKLGYQIYGADTFDFQFFREPATGRHLPEDAIREIKDSKLDFPTDHFDAVITNQVFEHIVDLETALTEIHRVMKPGGVLLAIFPSREIIREVHIGIPFAHRFRKDSKFRHGYTHLLRRLGFGYDKGGRSAKMWTTQSLESIDQGTRYRTIADLRDQFSRYFEIDFIEQDYIRYRLSDHKLLCGMAPLVRLPLFGKLAVSMYRRLGGVVLRARKAH